MNDDDREEITVGAGGCCAMTRRRGVLRHCQQRAIYRHEGRPYCYYHHPEHPRQFGEGYLRHDRRRKEGEADG